MVPRRVYAPYRHLWRASSASLLGAGLALFCAIPDNAHAFVPGNPEFPSNCEAIPDNRTTNLALNSLVEVEPSAGPLRSAKVTAILGGSPSRLEQMRMAQAAAPQQATTIDVLTPSIGLEKSGFACPIDPTTPDASSLLPAAGDAILGSMSVAIARTPFDRNWAIVNARPNSRKMQRTLAATGARHSGDQGNQIAAVNRWVNRNIAFGEDRDVYGRADYWAPASETLRRGIGDCEDFAIAKMELLSALGIARDRMRLVVARDLVRNADHAVLVVTMADGPVMLDNMTDRLLDARAPNDYRPIMSFSQNAKWVHGYAAQQAQPVRMALASPIPQPAANRLADVVTVTVEPEMPALTMALLNVPLALPSGLSGRA